MALGLAYIAAVAVLPAVLGACCHGPSYRDVVEIAPDDPGWIVNLDEKLPIRWEYACPALGLSMRLEHWSHSSICFIFSMYIDGTQYPGTLRLVPHGLSGCEYSITSLVGKKWRDITRGTLDEEDPVTMTSPGGLHFLIENLPWKNSPSAGDRLDASFEFSWDGGSVTCPLRFHVVRPFRDDF